MIIGGLDVGTTGCKIALYDENAVAVDTFYHEYSVLYAGGQHEISFDDVRNGVISLLKQACARYTVDVLGVTSFGETFAMLDENDRILAPSMLYTDPRGDEECGAVCDTLGRRELTLLTGVEPHKMYSIVKLLWLKNHRPEAFAKCRRVLLGEDYIVYTLTGKARIDYSLAARTGAFDIERKCWVREVFDRLGIDVSLLSEPVPTGSIAGKLLPSVKAEIGCKNDMLIVNGCHDQVASMIGSGVFSPEQAADGTGTVECIPVILPQKPDSEQLYAQGYSVVPYLDLGYACYALSYTGGATLKWFRDNFAEAEAAAAKRNGGNVYADLDNAVRNTPPTGILVLPHFAGAATPYMDSDSKAAFVGITMETTKLDLYKALMEGTSYEMLLNFNALRAFSGEIGEVRATGGGASSDVWLQIKADILGTGITALDCREVGAAGTAALAGVAAGVYSCLADAVAVMSPVRCVFSPKPENTEQYRAYFKKYENLYSAVKGL